MRKTTNSMGLQNAPGKGWNEQHKSGPGTLWFMPLTVLGKKTGKVKREGKLSKKVSTNACRWERSS